MILSLILAALLPVVPQPTDWKPAAGRCDFASAVVSEQLVFDDALGAEGYRLTLAPGRIDIRAKERTGILWARQTLAQLKAADAASAPCGEIFDKPKYRVRGFMMDVGRMFHSMAFLRDLAKTMAYYKMNTLHVHLNDNEGLQPPDPDFTDKYYAAFRMESTVYPGLTAKDGFYTKAEFRDFMLFCRDLGITVVPEIDTPAHSVAFTRFKPEFASKTYGKNHLDLDKTDEIIAWLKPLFAEYLTGDEPTFIGPYMHVGTDEYDKREAEKFRAYTDKMLRMVRGFGYTPCAWGALTHAKGTTPVLADRDVVIDCWHNPYYQPADALKAGYTIIAVPDELVYIVPFANYYRDYLDHKFIYETWEPCDIAGYKVPADKMDQLAGGKFALWNDLCGRKKDGSRYTEADNWDRIHPALQTLGQKFWSGNRPDQKWNDFASLADSLKEPDGVKSKHVFRHLKSNDK